MEKNNIQPVPFCSSSLLCTFPAIVTAKYNNCKFGNFRENFIFANSVKRHICDVKKSQLGHDLPTSVNDRAISLIREGFIFTKLCIGEVSRK